MPRPKKKKFQEVESLGQRTTTSSTGGTEKEEESADNLIEEDEHTHEDSDELSDKEARQEATELVNMARAGARAAAVGVRKAEAALRHEKRTAEERDKRWEAAERRKEPPPAYLQLERLYKGQVKMLRARLLLSQAQTGAAEAKARVQETLLMREELAHACTRCKLP